MKIDAIDSQNIKDRRDPCAELLENARKVRLDEDKLTRLSLKECRYCYYVKGRRQAVTVAPQICEECKVTFYSVTSPRDKFCEECAELLQLCKRCGAPINTGSAFNQDHGG